MDIYFYYYASYL